MEKTFMNESGGMRKAGLGIYLIALWTFFLPVKTNAQNITCTFKAVNDSIIKIHSPADILYKRLQVIRAIWGSDHIPTRSDVVVSVGVPSPLNVHAVVASVDKIEIPARIQARAGSKPVYDLAYLFLPVKRNGRLMIVHQGHACTFKDDQAGLKGFRLELAIKGLLIAGYDVLAVYMPLISETGCNLDHCSLINATGGLKNSPRCFGLRFFLEPTIVSLNYLLKKNNYKDVNMMGLSGGGWVTTLIAAVDDRIKYSFPVAGSTPMYLRWGGSLGDVEQFLPELYGDVAGYPDLYILGAYGPGRKQVQILNLHDNCCFGQAQHGPGRNYTRDLRAYEQRIKKRLHSLAADHHFSLVIDNVAVEHQVSAYALNHVILPQLSSRMIKH